MSGAKIVRAKSLRDALGAAFMHRGRVTWRAGTSALLGIEYLGDDGSAAIVDVSDVAEFRAVRNDRRGTWIGAFAGADTIAADPTVAAAIGDAARSPVVARFRLSALGAQLEIAGTGSTRIASLDDVLGPSSTRPLVPSEIPLAVVLHADRPAVWFGNRRINRRDGEATFELRVFVALTFSELHRIASAAIAYSLDGGSPIALGPVEADLRGANIAKSTFANAARRSADAFRGDNVHTSTLRRTIIPLVLSALKDAYAAARAKAK